MHDVTAHALSQKSTVVGHTKNITTSFIIPAEAAGRLSDSQAADRSTG